MAKVKPQLKVRAALMNKGYTIQSWADENGYKSNYVRAVLKLWAGKVGVPRGNKVRQLLTRLEVTTGKPIYIKID